MALTPAPEHALRHRVAQMAARQAGHVAVWQVRRLGGTATWVRRQVSDRRWADVHRGVHRVDGAEPSADGDLWAAMLAVSDLHAPDRASAHLAAGVPLVEALVRAVTDVAMATGFSAVWHMGATDARMAEVPELLVSAEVIVRRPGIRVVRTTGPMPPPVQGVVPRAPAYRVVRDCAWIGREHPAIAGILHGIAVVLDRTRQLSVDELLAVVDEPSSVDLPHRVPAALREVAELLRPGFSHSATESIAREIAVDEAGRLGLVAGARPLPLRHRGRVIAEADIAVEEIRWDAEVDGPHHRDPAVRARDRRRDARMASLLGWSVDRYDHTMVDEGGAAPFRSAFRDGLRARIDQAERTAG